MKNFIYRKKVYRKRKAHSQGELSTKIDILTEKILKMILTEVLTDSGDLEIPIKMKIRKIRVIRILKLFHPDSHAGITYMLKIMPQSRMIHLLLILLSLQQFQLNRQVNNPVGQPFKQLYRTSKLLKKL